MDQGSIDPFFLNNENWTKQKKCKNKIWRDAVNRDWSQIFSLAYLTYTLLAHVQSQDC